MIRCLIGLLLLSSASAACADPVLLLLLRMMRDQAISASLEAGVGAMRQEAQPQPIHVYALPTPAVQEGGAEQRVRVLIDENFLHLARAQRDTVFDGMQKVLNDPQHAPIRARIVAEFSVKARAVGEGYRMLERLPAEEKRALARQAKAGFRLLPDDQRRQLLDMLQAGLLPVPRDFNDSMLAELSSEDLLARNRRQMD